MAIRNAAKAILIHNDKVLLNKCKNKDIGIYYDLPGGGQNPYETMEQAVIREVLEETGYSVSVVRFAAVCEEIYLDEKLRIEYPNHTHRMFHIFIVRLENETKEALTEIDFDQLESLWIPLNEVSDLYLLPAIVRDNLMRIISSEYPLYLGSEFIANSIENSL